jgi:hypothetical protein
MTLQEIEQYYHQYTGMYDTGEISKEEYLNVLRGLEVEKAVSANAEEMQQKEQLNQIINAAINVVSAVA